MSIIKGYASISRYVIELEIDTSDAKNNLQRPVFDSDYAKYTCGKAFVAKITDKITNQDVEFASCGHDINISYENCNHSLKYYKGSCISVDDYDPSVDDFNSETFTYRHNRICFYQSRDPAYYNNLRYLMRNNKMNIIYKEWYDDGAIKSICRFIHGKRHGLLIIWYQNGIEFEKVLYSIGQMDGIRERWFDDGKLREKGNFIEGREEGLYECWSDIDHDKLLYSCEYHNGEIQNYIYKSDEYQETLNIISRVYNNNTL